MDHLLRTGKLAANSATHKWVPGPRWLLAAQMLLVIVLGACLEWWKAQVADDTWSYVGTSRLPWREALMSTRTVGYPLVLRLVGCFSPQYRAIPWMHLAALCACVFLFDVAAQRFGASAWDACAVSSACLYAALPWRTPVAFVLTDFLAMIMAVAAIACLLWIVADRRRAGVWIGLLLAVMAAYHLRPAYLFLVPLLPCLGVLLLRLHARAKGQACAWRGFSVTLLAVCFLPLVAYCGLRFAVVGQFGLVSFAGYNLSGLAAELLDPDMIERLPVRHRPLAREILAERAKRDMESVFRGGFVVDMRRYEDQFGVNIYDIAVPAAKRLYGDDPLVRDQELARFSRSVMLLKPGKYLLWIANYIPRVVAKIVVFQWIIWLLAPVAILLAVARRRGTRLPGWAPRSAREGLRVATKGACPSGTGAPACRAPVLGSRNDNSLIFQALLRLAPTYFVAYVLVLCLSGTYADSRIAVPAGVFIPALIALWCVREGRVLYGIWRKPFMEIESPALSNP